MIKYISLLTKFKRILLIMDQQENIWDKLDDMWMVEDERIIWEDGDNDTWMLDVRDKIADFITSLILEIIHNVTV